MKLGDITRYVLAAALALGGVSATSGQVFQVKVVDSETGRGVPLVELLPQGGSMLVTDSNGVVAITDPALLNKNKFFGFRSYGYSEWGQLMTTTPGGVVEVAIDRRNLAERLYRVTGKNIYGHSVTAGVPTPISNPVINAHVTGQDSVQTAVYKGQIYWFWGDTLFDNGGFNFRTAGARAALPANGGLDPSVGVNLNYFTSGGFAKQMLPVNETGLVWVDGLFTQRDSAGIEKLLTRFVRITPQPEDQFHVAEQGLALFNDTTQTFQRFQPFALDQPIMPVGHSFRRIVDGTEYIYFGDNYPTTRVKADWEHVIDPAKWEAYTPLKANTRYNINSPQLDLDLQGDPVFGWKQNTDPFTAQMLVDMTQRGFLDRDESPFRLEDHASGRDLWIHRAAVSWNEYRQNWIMIGEEFGGDSFLGELWFAEATTPEGPWTDAVKVITHDRSSNQDYTFYNPALHPYFDQDNGQYIYFEGTYTDFLIPESTPVTPDYNYNQIMYRLDLADIPSLVDQETDYDGDGDMDGGDFLAWQRSFGGEVFAGAGPDGGGNGTVDSLDLTLWALQFGAAGMPAQQAVPEPGALVLATAVGVVLAAHRRRGSRS